MKDLLNLPSVFYNYKQTVFAIVSISIMGKEEENSDASPTDEQYCKCPLDDLSEKSVIIPPRKQKILSTVIRTEHYLRDRRIPELIRFLLTKLIASGSDHPAAYLENLLNDCMLFRSGYGSAPVLYEVRHLEAVIKSFDPGQRGWLSMGQIRRLYTTLDLTIMDEFIPEKVSTDIVLQNIKKAQEKELFALLSANGEIKEESVNSLDSIIL